jgi:hypothetical protein
MRWNVTITAEVPNLGPGPGVLEDSVLGMADVMMSDRGAMQREITLTVEADDEQAAETAAIEELTHGIGGAIAGVPEIASIRVEPDE